MYKPFLFIVAFLFSVECQAIQNSYNKTKYALPEGFVYLDHVDSTIKNNLRYFSKNNFVGQRLTGYNANRVILTKEAANALKKAQQEFLRDGFSIVVYDAYRPQKAVDDFVEWSKQEDVCKDCKAFYYPYIDKSKLFEQGYIAAKSGHSRGSTVDIGIIRVDRILAEHPKAVARKLADNTKIIYLDDGTEDMGVHFDYFGEAAHHLNTQTFAQELQMRQYVKRVFENAGFKSYDKEWWHYTLKDEPFPNRYFDFDVQ